MTERAVKGVRRISEVERSGTMMAWGKRTSIGLGVRSWVLPSCAIGILAICSFTHPTFAQQQAPAQQTAAPATPEAPKQAKKKPNTKPAAEPATAAKKDPAVAQQQIDAGTAALQAGKHDQAVQQFTAALTGGSLPSSLMARAHHQRGIAYRKQAKPALAIEDLTHALWIKNGLTESDRADAMQNRIAAYRDAGLPDQADAEGMKSQSISTAATAKLTEPGSSPSPSRTGSIPPETPSAGLAPAIEPAPSSSGGIGSFFGNLFGGSSGTAAAATATPSAPKAEISASAWSAGTEVKTPAQKIKPASGASAPAGSAQQPAQPTKVPAKVASIASPPATAAAAPAKGNARFSLQVAQLKSREEAQSVAAQLKQQLGPDLAGREASIVAVSAGGFGTLHRLSFGPFADAAEWKDLCPKLLKAGHDCQPLSQ